jgi:hypothetical protein
MKLSIVCMTVLALSASGCISIAEQNANRLDALRERAAFDLACDAKIETKPLVTNVWIEQAGALGCGKRASYVWVDEKGWVLNAASQKGESSTSEPSTTDKQTQSKL